MRRRAFWGTVCAATTAAIVSVAGQQLRELSVSDQEAQDLVHKSFVGGYLALPLSAGALKALPLARRPELVRLAGALAKAYLSTDAFRRRYARDLAEGQGGEKPPVPPRKYADHVREQQAQSDEMLAQMRRQAAGVPAEQLRTLEQTIREELDRVAKAPAEERAAFEAQDRERFEQESEGYKEALASGRALPPDPNEMIRMRLRQFLTETADVDFTAALRSEGGKQRFARADYEAKPPMWKTCFRAGRAATDAARAFTASWLKELGG